jgi:excisionase family DNA binding protein
MTERLLTIPQFAECIGVSRATAYRIVADGLIDRTDVGRGGKPKTRISESALARYVQRHQIAGRRAA